LLEVVLALALFVAASTVITSALSASVDETERLRLNAHASNLAATILSEMQMGLQAVESSGPNAFEAPFAEWTWEAVVEPATDATGGTSGTGGAGTLQKVEVVIRRQSPLIVCRLTQFLPAGAGLGQGKGPADSVPGPSAKPPAASSPF
jgi:type II secretory pathway pseudopilin PulG